MSLRIIKAGILDTIQDMGRYGYRYLGINPGGAMDKYAAQIANCLAGNEADVPVIETHFPGCACFFEQPALIAVSGADFSPCINGDPVPSLQPILVSKYSILQFERAEKGARAYIAVHGGFDINKWLGSASTNLKIGVDGFLGRPLHNNDEIAIHCFESFQKILEKKEFIVLPWKADHTWSHATKDAIMMIPGPEWDNLDMESQKSFLNGTFVVNSQSDRMGYRLNGEPLSLINKEEMISSAVTYGTIQLLPDGQLIVLMADHQATGGYPRIGHVISAHHSKLAQTRAGESFRFTLSNQTEAEELFTKQYQHLQQLQNACKFRLEEFMGK